MLESSMPACTECRRCHYQVYDGTKPMDVVSKADNSPVTAADIAAHTVIMDGLRTLTPDIPVLSEEILPVGKSVSTGSVTGW